MANAKDWGTVLLQEALKDLRKLYFSPHTIMWLKSKVIKKVATPNFSITSLFMFIPLFFFFSKKFGLPPPCTSYSVFERSYPTFDSSGRRGWGERGGVATILTIWTTFCTYWLSIKIKISMTCKYQEYSIKMKIVWQVWTQFKMKFLLSYNMEIGI